MRKSFWGMLLLRKPLWEILLLRKSLWGMLFIIINACRLTVYEIHNYILFCLYLATILRNSMNNKFIKLVEQQLKIINYSWPCSELEPGFSFAINAQCHILTLLLNLTLNLNLILVRHLWIWTSVLFLLYTCTLLNKLADNFFHSFS